MFGNFEEEARKVLMQSKLEMKKLKHPYIGSEHLLLSILKDNNNVSNKLKDYGVSYELFRKEIINIIGIGSKENNLFLYTPLLKRVLESAVIDSKENNNGVVTINHLFSAILEEGEGVALRIILGMGIDVDKMYDDFSFKLIPKSKKNKKLLIEELGVDLTKKAINNSLDPVIGRDSEIKRVLEILSRRTKNNPLLVGEAGVGKTAIVEGLSNLIASGNVPNQLRNKRIISLDMATTVAGTKYRGEFEERMRKILKEIEDNDDIILFIDEIHTLVGAGGAEGAIDASNIFKPALARGKLRLIGATTIDEYKKFLEPDGALDRRFQKIDICIPKIETVKDILMKLKDIYEEYHLVKISEEMIDLIIKLSEKYIYDRNQPDKSIDILDEVCAKVSLKETKEVSEYNKLSLELQNCIEAKNKAIVASSFEEASIYKEQENIIMNKVNTLELKLMKEIVKEVTKEDIAYVLNVKTNIPIYELLKDNYSIIKEIKNNLKSKIVGQEKALEESMNIIKRIKLGFNEEASVYSLLFCGPSGVGKTELAKLFGKSLANDSVIRLDMSEFSLAHTVSKIIGAPPGYVGYDNHKNVLEEVRSNPYSVLILDEIEKAHPSILNLFFQILDEGKIKDNYGKEVRFDHITIIMTSNVGFLENNVGFTKNNDNLSKLKENFSVPFINRIDNIIFFNRLSKENISCLVNDKIKKIKTKYKKKGISITVHRNMAEEIIKESNFEEFGARKLDKLIKDKIEMRIIDSLIMGHKKVVINLTDEVKI